MFLQCGDHVVALASLQYADFFTDHFEGGADALMSEKRRYMEGRIVGGGLDVILGIEPEDDVDLRPAATSPTATAETSPMPGQTGVTA